jgi:rubrerythrin
MKDIDPELKYCPKCNDEYLAEIIMCAACEVELLTGEQLTNILEERQEKLAARSAELSPDDDLVVIRRGQLTEMQYLAQMLEKENIGSLLVGDMQTCAKDRFGNTGVHPSTYDFQVKREDAAEAMQIIETEHRKETRLDHHDNINGDAIFNPVAEEAKCPACGYVFPTTERVCPDCGLSLG